MIMEKYITKNGINYELRGEQYYPMLEISEQTNYEIGKYGHLHLDFIKKHRRGTYTTLLTEGCLNEHLHNIDELIPNKSNEEILVSKNKTIDQQKKVIVGVAIIAGAVIHALGNIAASGLVIGVGVLIGLALILYAQFKYNRGLF